MSKACQGTSRPAFQAYRCTSMDCSNGVYGRTAREWCHRWTVWCRAWSQARQGTSRPTRARPERGTSIECNNGVRGRTDSAGMVPSLLAMSASGNRNSCFHLGFPCVHCPYRGASAMPPAVLPPIAGLARYHTTMPGLSKCCPLPCSRERTFRIRHRGAGGMQPPFQGPQTAPQAVVVPLRTMRPRGEAGF